MWIFLSNYSNITYNLAPKSLVLIPSFLLDIYVFLVKNMIHEIGKPYFSAYDYCSTVILFSI